MEPDQKIIFLHIPKTGGTTIRRLLMRLYESAEYLEIKKNGLPLSDLKKMSLAEREKPRMLFGHMRFGVHEYFETPVKYFSMLRDPIERVISDYYHVRSRREKNDTLR